MSQSVAALVGSTTGNYFYPPNLSAIENINKAIDGVPSPAVDLDDGLKLLSAHIVQQTGPRQKAMIQDDHQQAVLIVNKNYDVLYAALFHRDCRVADKVKPELAEYLRDHPDAKGVSCRKRYVLTIFTQTTIPTNISAAFQSWVDSKFAHDKTRTEVMVLK